MKKNFLSFLASLMAFSAYGQTVPHNLTLAAGTVDRYENMASAFIQPRTVEVWLPEGYDSSKKYAVLYMHDGQMLFDSTSSWNKQAWDVDDAISQLMEAGKIRNTLVVGMWNTANRHAEYFPQKPFESLPNAFRDSILQLKRYGEYPIFNSTVVSDNYLKFIVHELKPFIDSTYSTHSDRENTFIAGSSMGGLISMYAICEYPDVFGGAACLSTHWPGIFDTTNNPIPAQFASYMDAHLPDPEEHIMYFDYGTETLDSMYQPYQLQVDEVMKKHQYHERNWKSLKFEGANHSEIAWRKRLHIPMAFLLEDRK